MYKYSDHTLIFLCIGGIFLAAVYHTILYLHRSEKLLMTYSQYLTVLFLYLLFRLDLSFNFTHLDFLNSAFNWDEVFQMASFMFYIRFAGNALFLKRSDSRMAWFYYQFNIPIVVVYCILALVFSSNDAIARWLQVIIRVYLMVFALLFIFALLRKRKSLYYNYLVAGSVSMIFFGTISALSMILHLRLFGLGPFHWLLFSFYLDVIFFSAALGYIIRAESIERENSLNQLLKKETELQMIELEKLKVVYETREEERMRIARDLHDDMGSTLSSIGIYTKVVGSYMDTDQQKAHEYLEKIQENTKMLMENTTDLIWSLQTNYGESETIFHRMKTTGIQLLSSANIGFQFSMPPENEVPLLNIVAQKNCWLIFKEAINNVCKYSQAQNCLVRISMNEMELSLEIKDDGVGIKDLHGGNGISNMRQRTEELNGRFEMVSSPGEGTTILACLSIPTISDTK